MTPAPRTLSFLAPTAGAVASALAYPFLPEQVATHFDAAGQPDRYSSRVNAALTMPAMMAALDLANMLFGVWPGGRDRTDDGSATRARTQVLGMTEVALLAHHISVLARGVGLPIDIGRVDRGIFGSLLVGLGDVLPKVPRNGLVGIRTPWTLADPVVWERTQRFGGYLVTAAGILTLGSVPWKGKWAGRVPQVAVLSAATLSSVYSLLLYRQKGRSPH